MSQFAFGWRGLSAALLLSAGVAGFGCSLNDSPHSGSDLVPSGPPEILQVFVAELDGAGKSALNVAYGCGDFSQFTPTGDTDEAKASSAALIRASCNEQPTVCCQRFYDSNLPAPDDGAVTTAVVHNTPAIRVVLDELLDGNTVEQFQCACAAPSMGLPIDCGPMNIRASRDPANCDDNKNTEAAETGKFADANVDGVPDKAYLLPGIATIDCGASGKWTNGLKADGKPDDIPTDQGWYNPSGDQLVPITRSGTLNWEAIGPALVLKPPSLPAGATCTLKLELSVTDKAASNDGKALSVVTHDGTDVTFTTVPLGVVTSVPADGQQGVSKTLKKIAVTFNTPLDPASVTAEKFSVTSAGGPIAGATNLAAADMTIEWVPTAALGAATTYTVKVSKGVKDSFGSPLADDFVFTFKTGS